MFRFLEIPRNLISFCKLANYPIIPQVLKALTSCIFFGRWSHSNFLVTENIRQILSAMRRRKCRKPRQIPYLAIRWLRPNSLYATTRPGTISWKIAVKTQNLGHTILELPFFIAIFRILFQLVPLTISHLPISHFLPIPHLCSFSFYPSSLFLLTVCLFLETPCIS